MSICFFESGDLGRGWNVTLEGLVSERTATRLEEVTDVLAEADRAARDGRWAAVVVAYDAAPAFEPAASVVSRDFDGPPLVYVGIYERGVPSASPDHRGASPIVAEKDTSRVSFHPSLASEEFAAATDLAREYIRDGETYQVNLTFPLSAYAPGDLERWYACLHQAQRAPYSARLDVGDHSVLSLSPELFFERRGERVLTRPMKGTAPRGRWLEEDREAARALLASDKERAENVMIVDLLRNDLGRLARLGTVRVPELFCLERYPTLWQITSAVEADVPVTTTLVQLFEALFPSGSVTGAPKIRTMDIITALERRPRGLYTGAIGYVQPGGDCVFNIAIRTIVVDRRSRRVSLGVGAGITFDSIPEREYEECLLKGTFAEGGRALSGQFQLLETMLLEEGLFPRLARHMERMAASAAYFGYSWRGDRVRRELEEVRLGHLTGCWRVRLTVSQDGTPAAACIAHEPDRRSPFRVALAAAPIDHRNPFLFNKTTDRRVYERARAERPDVDDVILWNAHGEVTESTIANLVVEINGLRCTPPIASGLLPGTYRAALVESGVLRERVVTRQDLRGAEHIWLINGLREWIDAALVP